MAVQNKFKKQDKSTINEDEVAFFNKIADEWWDPHGKFKPLHKFNPTRLLYLRDVIAKHYKRDIKNSNPFKGLQIADIGCGGGLLCEPFARLGADITGIDAAERNIKVAQIHAKKSGLNINYINKPAEALAKEGKKFDVVFAMEVVEHVEDVPFFIQSCAQLVKPGGLLFMATLNRTPKSWLFGIVGAEYIMRWLPKGTHDWRKFLKPSELGFEIERNGLKVEEMMGVTYSLIDDSFTLNPDDLGVNYMLYGVKTSE